MTYDKQDQEKYYIQRAYYICSLVGIEPQIINMDNYYHIRELLYLSLADGALMKARNELANILLFANMIGYSNA